MIGSTIFWTWLWGPLGLIAMPITVCLAVLGRHVEGLEFFDVLLGDQPALTPQQSFYQRALTGDAAEATYQAELCLKDQSLETYLDNVALAGSRSPSAIQPVALDGAQRDRIATTVKEMLVNLADFEPRRWFAKLRHKDEKEGIEGVAALDAAHEEAEEKLPVIDPGDLLGAWRDGEPVLTIGGRTALDEAAAAMLAEVLTKRGLGAKALGPEAISAGHITSLHNTEAKLVCLSYLGLGTGPAHIRYLVRRLRRILPEGTLILVAYWDEEEDTPAVKALLELVEADGYATSLSEASEFCVKAATGKLEPKTEDGAAKAKQPAKKPVPAVTPPPDDTSKPKAKKTASRVA
ncbi:MAG: hypothetical protein R3D30_12310 [Hyphomicrobiales bacterium]